MPKIFSLSTGGKRNSFEPLTSASGADDTDQKIYARSAIGLREQTLRLLHRIYFVFSDPINGETAFDAGSTDEAYGEISGYVSSATVLRTIGRGSSAAGRELIQAVRRGGILAFLIDQNIRTDSVKIPFFGHPALTPIGPAT